MKRGKKRKLDPTVEDEWRSEHEDTTNYGGQDGRLWRSVEMRARDDRLWRSVEMRARDTANHGGEEHKTQPTMEEKTLGYGGEDREKWEKRD